MKKKRKYQSVRAGREPESEIVKTPSLGRVRVGDVVQRRPVSFSDSDSKNASLMRGKVVYVHPAGRFHIVEFEKGVRESFEGVQR